MNGRRPLLPFYAAHTLLCAWCTYAWLTPDQAPRDEASRDVIELELLEYVHGGNEPVRTRSLSVSLSGSVAGESDLLDQPGACHLQARPLDDDAQGQPLLLELDCRTHAGGPSSFQLRVERAFERDEPSLIGAVDMHGARYLEVYATRR